MPISFEPSENTRRAREHYRRMAIEQMRPISRRYDVLEHEPPARVDRLLLASRPARGRGRATSAATATAWCRSACRPSSCAGATPRSTCACRPRRSAARPSRRRERRSRRRASWPASAATARRSGARWRSPRRAPARTRRRSRPPRVSRASEWVLNGTKIFCTSGESASQVEGGFVVVWATLDKSAGPRRDQVLRRARPDARHEAGRTREEARDPRLGHRDARLRGLPRFPRRTCSAGRR